MVKKDDRGLEDPKQKNETPWRVYSAHALSTWGDNMWWFAGGCYMLELHKESLRLTRPPNPGRHVGVPKSIFNPTQTAEDSPASKCKPQNQKVQKTSSSLDSSQAGGREDPVQHLARCLFTHQV
eukprot:TRINITY_DN20583_c0_g1_i1.p1 TRINITY_DN20583_c0_g1~~TRINITY_DN20583_c0_g1_i1.p1  ORF type:complete len:124 (-),score=21.33 TRINITY_DN20583_c0_g1_i1:161-532(-)